MAHTEFHDPNNPQSHDLEDAPPVFDIEKISTTEERSFISIDVIQYRGMVKLDGIFGRRTVDVDVVQSLIHALQNALDFIDDNPPRKRFR